MKFTKLISVIVIMSANPANAEPISIHGAHATMSYDQFMEKLRSKGHKCETRLDTNGEILAAGCMINKDVGDIVKTPNELHVSCHAYNGCGKSIDEVAQLLVNADIVQSLDYEFKWVTANGEPYGIYKGFGPDGDIIKVDAQVLTGNAVVTIEANPVNFGN